MPASHATAHASTSLTAMERLQRFVQDRARNRAPVTDFQQFEQELHGLVAEVECEAVADELRRLDLDGPAITLNGKLHRRVLRCEADYLGRGGCMRVERTLYRAAGDRRTVCPMELRAGIVEGYWTPDAAALAVWTVAHLTTWEAEELFGRVGGMTPSRSSLDRLPRELGSQWEAHREAFEKAMRIAEDPIPAEAVTVAVSLDGVMLAMCDGDRQGKRARAQAAGKETRGPAGYREAGCGTLTFYDTAGERLGTRYLGRMPEPNKATLKQMIDDELTDVLTERPDLTLVGIADGAKDNWTYLETLRVDDALLVLDFYHAAEHLKVGLEAAYGEGNPAGRSKFEQLVTALRDEPGGADKVIHHLAYLKKKYPRRRRLGRELRYFRTQRDRMSYADLAARHLPIGSGVVEAANKTLVTVRMKRAGARWRQQGGQAVLTFRALAKSGRFDRAWSLLARNHRAEVRVHHNVVPLRAAGGR
jgi:hypothetical protein